MIRFCICISFYKSHCKGFYLDFSLASQGILNSLDFKQFKYQLNKPHNNIEQSGLICIELILKFSYISLKGKVDSPRVKGTTSSL